MDKNILIKLHNIYTDNKERDFWINEFQNYVENNSFGREEEIIVQLSNDLDFYVKDISLRNEDPSYYGDKKLKQNLFNFLIKVINLYTTSG